MENYTGRSVVAAAQARLGDAIRERRKRYGWTQQELADRATEAGLSYQQGTVAKIESGSRPTPVGELAVLATVLGTTASKLLREDDHAREYWQEWLQLREAQTRFTTAENALRAAWREYWDARELLERYYASASEVLADSPATYSDKTPMMRSMRLDLVRAKKHLAGEHPNRSSSGVNKALLDLLERAIHGVDPEAS